MDDESELEPWEEIGWQGYEQSKDRTEQFRSARKRPRLFRVGHPRAINKGGYNKKEDPKDDGEIPYTRVVEYTCAKCFRILYNLDDVRHHKYKVHGEEVKITLRFVGIPNAPIQSRRGRAQDLSFPEA